MRALILTHPGLEETAIEEASKIAKIHEAKILYEGAINIIVEKYQDLAELCYRGRTFLRVILVLKSLTIGDMLTEEELPDFNQYLDKTASTECIREGEHTFTSFDLAQKINKILVEKHKIKIDHKNPQTKIFAYVFGKQCVIGIDFSGLDLGRRDYRIFLGRESLKGTIAAGLLFLADYKPEHIIIDPFCKQGIIPIEAALTAANISPHKYSKDKMAFNKIPNMNFKLKDDMKEFKGKIYCMDENFKNVSAAKKNAKIAGVTKQIQFSKTTLDWLDMKVERADRIVTFPIQTSRQISDKKISKTYELLSKQSMKILAKSGVLCICMMRNPQLMTVEAEKEGFKLKKQKIIKQGKEELTILIFGKK